MGASSRSPSPITTLVCTGSWFKTDRMASVAALSAIFPSPHPLKCAAAMAACSVARKKD